VHAGTRAEYLELALRSLEAQTIRPDGILLVEDGPLSREHETVIARAAEAQPVLRVLKCEKVGLADALNAGLEAADTLWVARMDADDVAEPDRLEKQLRAVQQDDLDVVGGAMWEFQEDPERCSNLRRVPESHVEIVRALRSVNPMNHPTVMMRRAAVIDVGGYPTLEGMEDYLLWARLAAAGAQFANLPDPLVRFRADREFFKRRADPGAVKAEWTLQKHLRHLGLVGPARSILTLVVRVTFRLLPSTLMKPAYTVVTTTLARRRRAAQ
jgi:glycosyltransferase involved in cell wall biosynthesis